MPRSDYYFREPQKEYQREGYYAFYFNDGFIQLDLNSIATYTSSNSEYNMRECIVEKSKKDNYFWFLIKVDQSEAFIIHKGQYHKTP